MASLAASTAASGVMDAASAANTTKQAAASAAKMTADTDSAISTGQQDSAVKAQNAAVQTAKAITY
ncbi:hypothetical protein AB7M29_004871 [Pseudomonas sp. F-14 TE3623]|uniref:ATP-dependent helicase HrpA n=1 Tax=Pseudomonas farris TaxID=2841207 RepID=A0ABS6PWU2_9PSED|nr:ATP-dependent helicase HrpA [Pseudomonas farris]MBV4464950.1 ATP-dependent helicase HrpA [Pseudomonas farris]